MMLLSFSDSHPLTEMKLNVLVSAVALLGAIQPRYECRAIEQTSHLQTQLQQQTLPILLRLGEEYFIRLDNANKNSPLSSSSSLGARAPAWTTGNRALQLQLRLLQGKNGHRVLSGSYADQTEDLEERGKRFEDPPISLDLTFHLLREVLEMARDEQIAQQAHSNRRMMDMFGK